MDIYERLGVRKAISCCGTFTVLGGAIMDPRVLDAMKEASRTHVLLEELQTKAGERIAELVGVEAAFITTGAAGGLYLSAAALLAGTDPSRVRRLPDTTGMKNEVIICSCQRFGFDQAIRESVEKPRGACVASREWYTEGNLTMGGDHAWAEATRDRPRFVLR